LTAECNLKNGLIDAIIPEPNGGAHRDPQATADRLQGWIVDSIRELQRIAPDTLVRLRFEKIRNIGSHNCAPPA
jgi:acetyl-CoA carboxylase carboxyl transferase subunit alpha